MINANNEYYQNGSINVRKDSDEWRAASGTCSGDSSSAVLVEKDITEDGTYSAVDDNADGYSEVVVDVGSSFLKVTVPGLPENLTQGYPKAETIAHLNDPKHITIFTSKTGEYRLENTDDYVICVDPVVSVTGFSDYVQYDYYVIFTPSLDYQGMFDLWERPITFSGDDVVPGDGKIYIAYVRYISTTYGMKFIMKKYDQNFYHTIE